MDYRDLLALGNTLVGFIVVRELQHLRCALIMAVLGKLLIAAAQVQRSRLQRRLRLRVVLLLWIWRRLLVRILWPSTRLRRHLRRRRPL